MLDTYIGVIIVQDGLVRLDAPTVKALVVQQDGRDVLEIPWPEGTTFVEALVAWKAGR